MKVLAGSGVAPENVNRARYVPGSTTGFYESFFQRANHPTRPLAFWIRYTLMSPRGRPDHTVGELWAVWFDGESGQHVAVKQEYRAGDFLFDRERFHVSVGDARLSSGVLAGKACSRGHVVSWDLRFAGEEPPLFLLQRRLYDTKLPRAKALVGLPLASYEGSLVIDGRSVAVDGWIGSQNHNWGTRHTDHYAWGQVAGFEEASGVFLEVATGRLKLGPCWTPTMTLLVLRVDGEELRCDSIGGSLCARASLDYFDWTFDVRAGGRRVRGCIRAPRESFVGLRYSNPPGGVKHCLNTKIADCRVEILDRGSPATGRVFDAPGRAAFEILTDDEEHGVDMFA